MLPLLFVSVSRFSHLFNRHFGLNSCFVIVYFAGLLRSTPYQVRFIRKVIDANAFRLYGHWIKKGDDQNRAALFENTLKQEAMLLRNSQTVTTGEVRFEY